MANVIKGEVDFSADGEDYILVLDFNALCDLESDYPGIMDGSFEMKSPRAVRKVFQVGLSKHHSDISEIAAGEIIQSIGIPEAAELVGKAFKASFPEAAKGGKARPPAK